MVWNTHESIIGKLTPGSMIKIRRELFQMQIILILFASASGALAERPDSKDFQWILEFKGKSTNEVVWDKRFETLLRKYVPETRVDLGMTEGPEPLIASVNEVFSGSPDDVVVQDGRFVILSASRHRSAMEKGFLWLDLKTGTVIGSVIHYFFNKLELENTDSAMLLIYSNQVNAESLPLEFQDALEYWIAGKNVRVETRRFAGKSRSIKTLNSTAALESIAP